MMAFPFGWFEWKRYSYQQQCRGAAKLGFVLCVDGDVQFVEVALFYDVGRFE